MPHAHDTLFVFDIETIPDDTAAPNLLGEVGESVGERRTALTQYHLDITDGKNSFLRQPFHKIVAISFLEAEIERPERDQESYTLTELRSGGRLEASEAELLQGFFHYIEKHKPRLVSFNGRTFDLPVLKFRAMKHGIAAPWLYNKLDKWSNYQQRYSADWHCDLLDVLTDYGAATRGLKLHEVASICGLPGKFGIDGSAVMPLYDAGKLDEIRAYCETDVLNTYLVYLRLQQHQGVLSNKNYQQAVDDVVHYLAAEGEKRSHLKAFADAWATAAKSGTDEETKKTNAA